MTTPTGGGKPTFGSPMGSGNMAKRMSASAAADLAALAASSKTYRTNMEEAAKAASKATAEAKKQLDVMKDIRVLSKAEAAKRVGSTGGAGRPVVNATTGGNGGGARMPELPWSTGGNIPQNPYGGTQMPPAAPAKPNGGGAVFGAVKKLVGGTAGAMGAGLLAAGIDPDTYRTTDFLANRASRISTGSYDKTAGARLTTQLGMNSFRSQEEQMQFFRPLISDNRTGFAANSPEMLKIARGAQGTAALNPFAGGTSSQTSVNFAKPETFNQLRMMTGIETVGRDGRAKTPEEVARELISSVTRGKIGSKVGDKSMTVAQTAAALGEGGGLRVTMNNAKLDEGMQSSIARYAEESAKGGKNLSLEQILARGKNSPGSGTMLGDDQKTATAKQGLTAEAVESYAKGYSVASTGMQKSMDALAKVLEETPRLMKDALIGPLGAVGALSQGGAPGAALAGGIGAAAGAALGPAGRAGSRVGRSAGRRLAGRAGAVGLSAVGGLPGLALGGAAALGFGAKGILQADYSGDRSDDLASMWEKGLGGAFFGYKSKHRPPGEQGDGYGTGGTRHQQIVTAMAGWGGVRGGEIGDSEMGGADSGGSSGGRGAQTYNYLKQLMASSGIPHRITSQVRPNAKTTSGGTSYHATGHALDIAGLKPGNDTPELLRINKFLASKLGGAATELIYSGPGAINLHRGGNHTYKGKVQSLHHDHVHVATTNEALKRMGKAPAGGGEGDPDDVRGFKNAAAEKTIARATGGRKKTRRKGFSQRNGFSERKLIEDVLSNVGSLRSNVSSPDVDLGEAKSGAGAGTASATTLGTSSTSTGAHGVDKYLLGLRLHESGGDYTAENGGTRGSRGGGDSSASGAYQYLDGTWGGYRGYKYAGAAPASIQDERARADASRLYGQHKDWRKVAAAHFRGEGWLRDNPDPSGWGKSDKTGGTSVPAFVSDVLKQGGLPETGDGYGSGGSMGAPIMGASGVRAEVPEPHSAGRGGGGNVRVSNSRGGSLHIAKVEVHLTTPQVSDQEASRIGSMVVSEIARQARMKEMSS